MRQLRGFGQDPAVVRPGPEAVLPVAAPTVKEIPYDYVARFVLEGIRPGRRVEDVINISIEGAFVAAAIGYSFIPQIPEAPTGLVPEMTTSHSLMEVFGGPMGLSIRTVSPITGANGRKGRTLTMNEARDVVPRQS